jgi:hypothetical protein
MASLQEQDPQVSQEKQAEVGRSVGSIDPNIIERKKEAVWKFGMERGIWKAWLTKLLLPAEVMDIEKRVQEQGV